MAGDRGVPAPGTVGLTFDDGPDPVWTPVVLDILDEYGVTATFFVLGWKVDAHPELAREIVVRGHSIQVHGYHHNLYPALTDAQIRRGLAGSVGAIYRATGVRPTCFRAPGGASTDRVAGISQEFGLTIVRWDFNTADYVLQSAPGVLRKLLLAEPDQSVLMHDIWGVYWQSSLPTALAEFATRGYVYDTVCANNGPYGRVRVMQVGISAR